MTAELVAFLREQIAEDRWVAELGPPWPWSPNAEIDEVVAADGITVATGYGLSNNQLRNTVEHIARWDPARVLSECDFKERLITMCGKYIESGQPSLAEYTLKALALPYADRSGVPRGVETIVTPSWLDPSADAGLWAGLQTVMPPAPSGSEILDAIARLQQQIAAAPPAAIRIRCGADALELLRACAVRGRSEYIDLLGVPVQLDPVLPPNFVFVHMTAGPPKALWLAQPERRSRWRRLLNRVLRRST